MRTLALLLAALCAAALVPTVNAAEPGGGPPEPWILQGTAIVRLDGEGLLPCVDTSAATIYTWVQSWSANFQLSTLGGCDTLATEFGGTGDIWEGFTFGDLLVPLGTSGSMTGFFEEPVRLELHQTLPDGRALHIEGDFVVVF